MRLTARVGQRNIEKRELTNYMELLLLLLEVGHASLEPGGSDYLG